MAPLIADGGTTSANLGQAPIAKVAVYALGWPHLKPRARQVGVSEGTGHGPRVSACQVWPLKPRDMANNVVEDC